MTEHDWDHVLDVNLKGSCFCAQSVAKAMVSAKRMGSIINADGINHQHSFGRGTARLASGRALRVEQGGVLLLTRAMALGLAPYRIRVKRSRRAHGYSPATLRQQRRRNSPIWPAQSRSAAWRSLKRSLEPQCSGI